jgi:hypothetical protein
VRTGKPDFFIEEPMLSTGLHFASESTAASTSPLTTQVPRAPSCPSSKKAEDHKKGEKLQSVGGEERRVPKTQGVERRLRRSARTGFPNCLLGIAALRIKVLFINYENEIFERSIETISRSWIGKR